MDNYTMFFGFCMFVIGMIVGRITMAIQYEVMKPIAGSRKKRKKKPRGQEKKRIEQPPADEKEARREFYDYMRNRRP